MQAIASTSKTNESFDAMSAIGVVLNIDRQSRTMSFRPSEPSGANLKK